jgi:NCS1 family nucleobase:cation symporter-1
VLIADYWLVRRSELRLADLYRRDGAYWYNITTTGWWDSRWHWSFTGG